MTDWWLWSGMYQDAFKRFCNDEGSCTSNQIGPIMRSFGQNPAEAEIQVRSDVVFVILPSLQDMVNQVDKGRKIQNSLLIPKREIFLQRPFSIGLFLILHLGRLWDDWLPRVLDDDGAEGRLRERGGSDQRGFPSLWRGDTDTAMWVQFCWYFLF